MSDWADERARWISGKHAAGAAWLGTMAQALRDLAAEKDNEIEQLRSALRWCSGSADFHEGGDAEEGWRTICEPLLDEGNQKP